MAWTNVRCSRVWFSRGLDGTRFLWFEPPSFDLQAGVWRSKAGGGVHVRTDAQRALWPTEPGGIRRGWLSVRVREKVEK